MSMKVGGIWDTVPAWRSYLQDGPDLQASPDLDRGLALTW